MSSEARWRRLLLAGAAVYLAIAVIVTILVIPAVKTGLVPQVTPEKAVPAFVLSAILHAFLGIVQIAAVTRWRGLPSRLLLAAAALIGLALGLALLDAATALVSRSSSLRVAAFALFASAAGDFLAGVSALASAALRGGKPATVGAHSR